MMSRGGLVALLALLAAPARALQAGAAPEPALGSRPSLLQTEAEEDSDSGAVVSLSTFSVEEWRAMRKATYEDPFTIELDMAAAHEGMNIGADLFSSADTKPLAVQKIGDAGLVEKWNKAHPEKAVQVGDEFVKVSDVEWSHSNKQLVQQLKFNFDSLKQQGAGTLQVSFQRPRRSKVPVVSAKPRASLLQTATESEEESDSGAVVSMSTFSAEEWKAMRKATYEDPFTIELDMAAAHEGMNIGADLFSSADTKPLAVQKIGDTGLVEKWNKAHPDKAVQVGDEFVKVSDVEWSHSNKQLVQQLKFNFDSLKQQGAGTLQVSFQRPRRSKVPVVSAKPRASLLQTATEAEEESDSGAVVSMSTFSAEEWKAMRKATYEDPFTIELDMAAAHEGMNIGADLFSTADTKPLAVQKIGDTGLVEKWNKAHPDKAVQVGDEFVKVSDVEWSHSNKELIQHLKESFNSLKQQGAGALQVSFQRPRSSKLPVESARPRASLLQTATEAEEESDSGAVVSMSTVSSTEEWKAMRRATYEEPFTIELDMAAAHEGKKIGADLFSPADTKPLAVQKVVQEGLVEAWNRAHPDQAVQVGDEFVRVGDVEWQHSNKELVQHLKDNFDSLKQQGAGALQVSFQRPRRLAKREVAAGAPLFGYLPLEGTKARPSLLQTQDADASPELQAIWER